MEQASLRAGANVKVNQDRCCLGMCSACRGDYEDPDAVAEPEEGAEENAEEESDAREFPAGRDRGL